ncbi:hypothetical protein [Ostreiculturibacter nitratireducens]|uniref:hypothetical protein n=1 Tax=Ostreiculturibacter nitratireducens TaxID=3075226 RepID=UPI0031B6479A
MSEMVLASISAPAPRRAVAIVMVAALGILLIALGVFRGPESVLGRVALVIVGGIALALADMMRKATALRLELTATELTDTSGRVLARVEDIVSVDRGAFAFKPSNGFLLKLRQPAGRVWAPGLYWRLGRRIGVGGVISKTEGRNMADTISALISDRR